MALKKMGVVENYEVLNKKRKENHNDEFFRKFVILAF